MAGADATAKLQKGHLLANILGGRGDHAGNLAAIYASVNNGRMKSLEYQVRMAVEAGETVEYRVTPIYDGNNLVPTWIKMEAKGDDGFVLTQTLNNKQ